MFFLVDFFLFFFSPQEKYNGSNGSFCRGFSKCHSCCSFEGVPGAKGQHRFQQGPECGKFFCNRPTLQALFQVLSIFVLKNESACILPFVCGSRFASYLHLSCNSNWVLLRCELLLLRHLRFEDRSGLL